MGRRIDGEEKEEKDELKLLNEPHHEIIIIKFLKVLELFQKIRYIYKCI
jgi:hypothetical protein